MDFTHKQLKNQWEYLRKKFNVWARIMEKTGNVYDAASY